MYLFATTKMQSDEKNILSIQEKRGIINKFLYEEKTELNVKYRQANLKEELTVSRDQSNERV